MVLGKGLFAQGGAGREDSLQTRVAYTWSRFKFTDNVFAGSGVNQVVIARDGNTVAGAPEHSLKVEARYDHPAGWWIAPNLEWSLSGFYTDYNNTIKNPSYALINLRSGWNIDEHWTLFAEGRNLTNKTYAGAVVVNDQFNRFANPGLGISAFGGVEYKF